MTRYSRIAGTGSYLPPRRVTNADLAAQLAQRGLARVQLFFQTLDALLSDRPFVAGGAFSVADITAVVAVDFARIVKLKPDERHPHLLRWRSAMAERDSMKL